MYPCRYCNHVTLDHRGYCSNCGCVEPNLKGWLRECGIEKEEKTVLRCKDCYFFVEHMKKYFPQDWQNRVESLIYFPCTRLVRFKNPNSKTCELFVDNSTRKEPETGIHRSLEVL